MVVLRYLQDSMSRARGALSSEAGPLLYRVMTLDGRRHRRVVLGFERFEIAAVDPRLTLGVGVTSGAIPVTEASLLLLGPFITLAPWTSVLAPRAHTGELPEKVTGQAVLGPSETLIRHQLL